MLFNNHAERYWFFIFNRFAWIKQLFALFKSFFSGLDLVQSFLFVFQVFWKLIPRFLLIGLVFFLVTPFGLCHQRFDFIGQLLFFFFQMLVAHRFVLGTVSLKFRTVQADMAQ